MGIFLIRHRKPSPSGMLVLTSYQTATLPGMDGCIYCEELVRFVTIDILRVNLVGNI